MPHFVFVPFRPFPLKTELSYKANRTAVSNETTRKLTKRPIWRDQVNCVLRLTTARPSKPPAIAPTSGHTGRRRATQATANQKSMKLLIGHGAKMKAGMQ
jgi:hypothetical protein